MKLALNADETRSVGDLGSALAMQLEVPWQGESTWERMRVKLLGSRALLHIENADAETSAQATAALVRRLDGCAVIVSGRYQGLGAGVWTQITIDTLGEETAIDLLQREAEIELSFEDKKKLARELGYLPLALHLAAGHLRAKVSVELFLRRLRDRKNLLGIGPRNLLLDKEDKRGILSSTFALSLDLLKKACGENGETWMQSFATLGHAPASGVGKSLGAAMAGLSDDDFEDLMDRAVQLSLATRGATAKMAWSVHPLLGLLLRRSVGEDAQWMRGMTEWFLERLPGLDYMQAEEQARRWKDITQEGDALVSWLEHIPLEDAMRVARQTRYAVQNGPFSVWMSFCERVLATTEDLDVKAVTLWTLFNVSHRAGLNDRALAAAQSKMQVEMARGDDRGIALAAGAVADIFEASGELDDALRIRRDEQLPVYERLGEVRERAVTMGKIAQIFETRGELDEALRIRRDEQLPVFKRLGDIREQAVTMGQIADILVAYGRADEALRIRRDEQLPVFARLGDIHALLITRANLAQLLVKLGHPKDRAEAADLLRLALRDAEAMDIPEAAQIRAFQRDHNLT